MFRCILYKYDEVAYGLSTYLNPVVKSKLWRQLAREILPNGPVGVAMAKVAINKGSEVKFTSLTHQHIFPEHKANDFAFTG